MEQSLRDKIFKKFEKDLFAKTSGIELIEVLPGYAKANMKITGNHLNAVGLIQGGAIFTLADFAFAVASNSRGKIALAIDAEISFFKSVSKGTLTAKYLFPHPYRVRRSFIFCWRIFFQFFQGNFNCSF